MMVVKIDNDEELKNYVIDITDEDIDRCVE